LAHEPTSQNRFRQAAAWSVAALIAVAAAISVLLSKAVAVVTARGDARARALVAKRERTRWAGKPTPSRMLTGIKSRGTRDVLMVVCDGLMGLTEAIARLGRLRVTQPRTVVHCAPASPPHQARLRGPRRTTQVRKCGGLSPKLIRIG
jgi:Transposase, Mutator family